MSFWTSDCSKLQFKGTEHAGDSTQPESSLWAPPLRHAGSPHAADSAASDGRMRRSMHQRSIVPGTTLSLDETADQSVDNWSVQQHAWHWAPDGGADEPQQQEQQRRQLPAEDLLLPQLSSLSPYSTAADGLQQSVQCSYDGAGYAIEQQARLPAITPPASPTCSEETVGFAPGRSAAAKALYAQAPAASEDISSHWRSTKRRRLAGASIAESLPHAQRSLDLTDDAESNMPPSVLPAAWSLEPQRRGHQQFFMSRASHHEGMLTRSQRNTTALDWGTAHQDESPGAAEQMRTWDESFHPLPHPLDPEE